MQERIQEVRTKIAELVLRANQLYNITLPPIDVRFDAKGRAAGWAGLKDDRYFMRFNLEMMRGNGWDHIINDTVPHELAHIVCFYQPTLGRRHNPGWKRVCMQLGGSGERCHKEETAYAHGRTFAYTTTTGHTVKVSETIHRRIQQGRMYRYRDKGDIHAASMHQVIGVQGRVLTPVSAVPPVTRAPAAPQRPIPPSGAGTNAERIRERIRLAKRQGENMRVVIDWGVTFLGQSRGLATSYVKNNWDRV